MTLYRTQRESFVMYPSDGLGRDRYIKYNNGGFWKGREDEIALKPTYPNGTSAAYYSLNHEAASLHYRSDGSGRDSYIIENDGGLVRSFCPMSRFQLKDILRTPDKGVFNYSSNANCQGLRKKILYVSRGQIRRNDHLRNVEKGLINRLYTKEKEKISERQSPTKTEYWKAKTVFPKYETERVFIEPLKTETDFEKVKGKYKKVERYELDCSTKPNYDNNNIKYSPRLHYF